METTGRRHVRDYTLDLVMIAALLMIVVGLIFTQVQALLPVASLLLVLRIYLTTADRNIRRLLGVLSIYFGASFVSNAAWYLLPTVVNISFLQSDNYKIISGMFWLVGDIAIVWMLLNLKNSKQWYIERRLDRLITAVGVLAFFLIALYTFFNNPWNNPHLIDILILLTYLCADVIILMMSVKLILMKLPWELKYLVYALFVFFAINGISDLIFETRFLYHLKYLLSLKMGGFELLLMTRDATDIIYNVSLLIMAGLLFLYSPIPFLSPVRDDIKRRLSDTQMFMDDLIANSPDATCIFDRDGGLLLVNDPFLQFFGLKRNDVDRSFNVFKHMGHIIGKYAEYVPVLKVREGETVIIPKLKVTMKGGRKGDFYLFLKMFPTYGTDGQIANYVLIIEDITERVRLEDDLFKAYSSLKEEYERKTDFTNAAAHELRTPLTPIIGYTDILKSEVTDKRHRKFLEIIERNALRQKSMVNSMLELASLDAGMMQVRSSGFSVRPLADEVADNYRTVNPNIRVDVPEGLRVNTDHDILRHVLDNLVSNAVKYSSNDKNIVLTAIDAGDHYQFSVKDQGAGIPKEEWGRIFERFYIVGGDKDNRAGGRVGLGLALVKAYVSLIGGTVRLESEPGRGSAFYFTVPKTPPPD